eukprot:m.219565 g.219565  ORF g.219565 m.219565 type:complete len:107 (+) comp15584_c0_seq1:1678-1998(+)
MPTTFCVEDPGPVDRHEEGRGWAWAGSNTHTHTHPVTLQQAPRMCWSTAGGANLSQIDTKHNERKNWDTEARERIADWGMPGEKRLMASATRCVTGAASITFFVDS